MDRLLAKLSGLDAGAEAAVRVIAAFDRLVERQVPIGALTRATAALAQCVAGISRPDGAVVRFAPNGDRLDDGCPDVRSPRRCADGITVWLERSGTPDELDDLILERFTLAACALMPHRKRLQPRDIADPALTEVLISGSHSPEDRARAIRLLGLDPYRPVRVVAVATTGGEDADAAAAALVSRGPSAVGRTRVAAVGSLAAAILQPRSDPSTVVSDLRGAPGDPFAPHTLAGVGGAVLPHLARQSWLQGKLALRFAEAGTVSAVVDHDQLGALALLADVPSDRLAANPDVVALAELAATDGGRLELEAVDALCRTGSLRQAAASLHMHHSTVAARITRAERKLGWNFAAPSDTLRASIALHALQLLRSSVDERASPRTAAVSSSREATAIRRHLA
ncbi:LysR family transcriptional regulator [Rhodococcus hoagii]|nr:LysR family transcriptional regulator [Prescottella equi]